MSLNDSMRKFLNDAGYSGSLNDMASEFLESGTAAKMQALVSRYGKVTGSVARYRHGRAVLSAAAKLCVQNAWRVPRKVVGFRLGIESNETTDITISLAKFAATGNGTSDTPTAAVDSCANYSSSSPVAITFNGGSSSLVVKARTATDRPGPVQWTDWIIPATPIAAGKMLVVRALFSASTTYPYSGLGFTYSDLLAATSYPVAAWNDTTDRVTADAAWPGTLASNATGNPTFSHIELMFADDAGQVLTVCSVGDSTEVGTVDSGAQALASVQAACEELSTSAVYLSHIARGWGGKKASEYYNYLLRQLDDQTPHVLHWLAWSQNNTTSEVSAERAMIADVVQRCQQLGVVPIIGTGIPSNTSNQALDDARKALNAYARSIGAIVCDRDAVISDGATPARYKTAYGSGAHPNLAGYADLLSQAYIPAVRSAVAALGVTV